MAEHTEEKKAGDKNKFSLFNPSEWPQFIWNWFWRLPGIKRFNVGRSAIGGRRPPIWYYLDKTWFPKNDAWFNTKLRTIEDFWTNQGKHYGDGKESSGEGSLRGNPE